MGTRLLNLNNYEPVSDIGDATLRIRPKKLADGTQLPDMYFKTIRTNGKAIVTHIDVENGTAVWSPTVTLDTKGTPEQYIELIEWWFRGAQKNESYSRMINEVYEILGDILTPMLEAKAWLLEAASDVNMSGGYPRRKSQLNKFVRNWMNKRKNKIITGRR